MLMSDLFGENLFDEFWGFPTQHELANLDKRLYGKNAQRMMSTDVHETEENYEMDMDLPGFKKDQINIHLIISIGLVDIGLHEVSCVLSIEVLVDIGKFTLCR